jgi:hypothetical protein
MHQDERFAAWLLREGGRTVVRYYGYAGDVLMAYAYVDLSERSTARLIDFAARDAASLRALLDSLIRDLKQHPAVFLHVAYNFRNPLLARLRTVLLFTGFVPFYRGGGFVIRPLDFSDPVYFADLSSWYITPMWAQLYPDH